MNIFMNGDDSEPLTVFHSEKRRVMAVTIDHLEDHLTKRAPVTELQGNLATCGDERTIVRPKSAATRSNVRVFD